MKAPVALATALVAATSLLIGASPAFSTPPGNNGRIVFRRFFTSAQTWGALFTVRPNGTALRRVTYPRHGIFTDDPD
jgi:hypothetical protein